MDAALVGQFWLVAGLLVLTPGADWAYAIAAGLRARSIVPSVLGILTGYAIVVAVVAVGVGALVAKYPAVLTTLTLAGGLYLLWLGGNALLRRAQTAQASEGPLGGSGLGQFVRGIGVSGLNPKGLLLLLAMLPQFVTPAGLPTAVQMAALGGIHLGDCAVVYLAVGHLSGRILRSRPTATIVVTKVAGAAMVLIGAGLLVERVVGVVGA